MLQINSSLRFIRFIIIATLNFFKLHLHLSNSNKELYYHYFCEFKGVLTKKHI